MKLKDPLVEMNYSFSTTDVTALQSTIYTLEYLITSLTDEKKEARLHWEFARTQEHIEEIQRNISVLKKMLSIIKE